MNRTTLIAVAVVAAAFVLLSSLFTVRETEQAIILQFGRPVDIVRDPGLNMKLPFVQEVVKIEDRVLDVDPPGEQVILGDQKRLEVDSFARYRIVNPLLFFQTAGNEIVAEQRLSAIISATMRRVLGASNVLAVLSRERGQIMNDIRTQVNDQAKQFGIEIVDVRIRRADLPEQTSQATYERMKSEREREAREARAQGFEQQQQIKATADRERTVLIAEAQREAQVLRGQGDEQAIRILAESYGRDAEFFAFYRTLQAYRTTFGDKSTTMVLTPEGEFFRYFNPQPSGPGAEVPNAPPAASAATPAANP